MGYTITHITALVKGSVKGDMPDVEISRLARIEDAEEGSITFLANMKYEPFLYSTKASAVIVNADYIPTKNISPVLISVPNAYDAFTVLTNLFAERKQQKYIVSEKASLSHGVILGNNVAIGDFSFIGENTSIGNNVVIFPQVYLGSNVTIGNDTVLYPGVKIYDNCKIGSFCKIHSGVVIGSDGFGFAPQQNSAFNKIEQIGNVVIEDNVEIGANSTIDRAAISSTIIRKGVKIDNLIQIAHNVEIGENTVIAAQTGISGSAKIGKNCMIGGQVGIVGHISIADNVKIAAQSGIGSSITKEGVIMQGSPAFEISQYRRAYACFKNLPQYFNLFYKFKKEDI
ncbi:MAG: UDP-3-O-(3-hydroxymyristoyl)glucosamine N-acyltransferase [Bacteroidales bacterium]|nr:UDP-3-O-(3-hydroxymyristoyl)glucosamine N-acyltransferase [Bacteroidales bacterium]